MSILIKGMDMPKEGYRQVFITSDGKAIYFPSTPRNGEKQYEVVSVQPHGRLIDADVLLEHMKKIHDKWKMEEHYTPTTDDEIITMNMPTIIEAEED